MLVLVKTVKILSSPQSSKPVDPKFYGWVQIRVGLEEADSGAYQRRVGHVRLLGESYNFRLVNSAVIFETLYLLLDFGHASEAEAAKLDPPDNYFRIR